MPVGKRENPCPEINWTRRTPYFKLPFQTLLPGKELGLLSINMCPPWPQPHPHLRQTINVSFLGCAQQEGDSGLSDAVFQEVGSLNTIPWEVSEEEVVAEISHIVKCQDVCGLYL